jgi:hypothetical protein
MKSTDDPLIALLDAARSDDAGHVTKMRVRAALAARLAFPADGPSGDTPGPASPRADAPPPTSAPAPAPPPTPSSPMALSLGKAGVLALLTGALGFAAGLAVGGGPAPATSQAPPVVQSHAALTSSTHVSPHLAPSSASIVVSPPLAEPAEPALSAMPRASSDARSSGSSTAPEASTASGAPGAASAALSPSTAPAASASADSSLAAELALLREVHGALREGDAARAERWLGEHATRFPGGVLREEREASRVLLLCARGRMAEARAEADRFLSGNPRSMQGDRVRGSCAFPAAPATTSAPASATTSAPTSTPAPAPASKSTDP